MSRIELSIIKNYVPSWNAWNGVRELVQNAVDAEKQFNAPMEIDWHNNTLRIENSNITLPKESLLLGFTTKDTRSDLAGKWGEGYKLGVLALVRAGHSVRIRNGSEVWTPSIAMSEKYNAEVLVFDIKGNNAEKDRVRVEIGGISQEDWMAMKEKFIFLNNFKKGELVNTKYGDLLMGEEYRSMVFVKGIFVQSISELRYGYNFEDAEVDRDRKMVNSWDLRYKTAKIWQEAANKTPELLNELISLATKNIVDIRGMDTVSVPMELSKLIADKFHEQYGDAAIPVQNISESRELEHLGAKGIVTSEPLTLLLRAAIGSQDQIAKQLREEVVDTYSWGDLSKEQQSNFDIAMTLLSRVNPRCSISSINVVKFRDDKLNGQCKDGKIFLSISLFTDADEVIATAIHEFAHLLGSSGDGEAAHVCEMRNLWRDVVKHLRTQGSHVN